MAKKPEKANVPAPVIYTHFFPDCHVSVLQKLFEIA